jgi:hypothetical protein
MICMECNNDLVDCDCPDIETRLLKLRKSQYIDQRMIDRIIDARQVKRDTKSRPAKVEKVKAYYEKPHEVDDPMWVIGSIDHAGAIHARHAGSNGRVMHGLDESKGKRWRWNIWAQEYVATRNASHERLSHEECTIVDDWLEKKGYKKADE